jgi:hypothetical protein
MYPNKASVPLVLYQSHQLIFTHPSPEEYSIIAFPLTMVGTCALLQQPVALPNHRRILTQDKEKVTI